MARSRSNVFIGPSQFRSVKGVEKVLKAIAAIPDEVVAEVTPYVRRGGERIVKRFKAIAPVDPMGTPPGEYRDSAHVEDGDHPLAVLVVVDAKDEKGRDIAKHVEHGHKAEDGSHVPAQSAFWPSYRVERKRIRRDIATGTKNAVAKAAAIASGDPT